MIEYFEIEFCKGRWYVISSNETIVAGFDDEESASEECFKLNVKANNPSPCEYCNSETDVEFSIDPYAAQIQNNYEMHWLCCGCLDRLSKEV